MAAVSGLAEAIEAIRQAREVHVASYTLRDGALVRALEDAARTGVRVTVRLDGAPYGGAAALRRRNRHVVRELRACGADAAVVPRMHAKTVEADGALFLDGRNWGGRDLIVRADASDDVARTKRDALAGEAALLDGAGDAIVETETFGSGNAVYCALERLARAGFAPRLLVNARRLRENPRERALLERLARDGVRVRATSDAEKCAIAGDRAWLGSANASWDGKDEMTDWGLCTKDAGVVSAARARLEADWASGSTLKA
jgi:phosphatidylserine/phosphatidylglycerophosphate/cardiolipin synthase-like enzyme